MPLKKSDEAFWSRVKELAKSTMKSATYDFFIEPAELVEVNGNQATILVGEGLHKDYWRNQDKLITTAGLETYGDMMTYTIVAPGDVTYDKMVERQQANESASPNKKKALAYPNSLNRKYTFNNFVEGINNKMAVAACQVATDAPGDKFNPLFIYGESGVGKTHLLHAIGNEFLRKHPHAAIRYASSETFVTDYVNSARNKQMDIFVDFYRNLDMLLLDDIQFFSDKEGTKNEFFNTFEALYNKGAQIVLTSDRDPRELDNLEQRLVSRFTWGVTTQIQAPDYENRLGILMNKVEGSSVEFPVETLQYIAGQISSNVRELEGALAQIELAARLANLKVVDIETAESALKTRIATNTAKISNLTVKKIQDSVSKFYEIPLSDLIGPKRLKEIVFARQVAMYLIRNILGTSLPNIGKEFGNRDHTTVMYGIEKISERMKIDIEIQKDIDSIKRKLV